MSEAETKMGIDIADLVATLSCGYGFKIISKPLQEQVGIMVSFCVDLLKIKCSLLSLYWPRLMEVKQAFRFHRTFYQIEPLAHKEFCGIWKFAYSYHFLGLPN